MNYSVGCTNAWNLSSMTGKVKTQYQCNECGAVTPKWTGQCADCSAWNTLSEVTVDEKTPAAERFQSHLSSQAIVRRLDEVDLVKQPRMTTGSAEFDRSLGGGLVSGSVVLLGGDPGIGKSTLLLQVLSSLAENVKLNTLYVSGEESIEQISLRAARLGLPVAGLHVLAEIQLENIFAVASRHLPQVLVVDSIQTVFSEALQSAPGSVAQVRECAARLVRFAKQTQTTVFLVGHVTKEGALAGPRVLEHVVDTVLYFEGDGNSRYRMIRSVKNRYGAVNELGVFAMTDKGLREVNNPSAIFLSAHSDPAPGTAVLVTREGSRPLLVEVQALVDQSHGNQPRRVTVGLEQNRLSMLLAVLHRHAGIVTYDQDVFVNVVGGVKLTETAADLAILMAVLSSLRDRPLADDLIIFGEVGLTGEIRPVQEGQERLKEASKHGFTRAVVPAANAPKKKTGQIEIFPAGKLSEAIEALKSIE